MTLGLTGMGGGQMYIRNKMIYMQKKGWDVCPFGCLRGPMIIEELKKFEDCTYDELTCSPFVYSRDFISKTMKKILSRADIKKNDEVVVESGTAHMAYWAELLAEYTQGEHVCYLLDERNDLVVNEKYLDFFSFKLSRGELAGINKKSLKYLFRNMDMGSDDCYPTLPAMCQNVVQDVDIPRNIAFDESDITIGSIGRLEKSFVPYMIGEILKFALEYPDKKILLILIGGTNDEDRLSFIKKEAEKTNNLKLIITGYLLPIPLSIFNKIDLFISSAGSAGVSYRQQVPTISMDAADGKPIGVLGYTTQKTLYRENEEIIELSEWLKKIFIDGFLNELEFTPMPISENLMEQHTELWDKSSSKKEYYDIENMKPYDKDFIKYLIIAVLGDENFLKLKIRFSYKNKYEYGGTQKHE